MIPFFQQIANIINSVIHFIVHGIEMIVLVLMTMVRAVAFIVNTVAVMPLFVVAPILVSISIAAVLFLINKGS